MLTQIQSKASNLIHLQLVGIDVVVGVVLIVGRGIVGESVEVVSAELGDRVGLDLSELLIDIIVDGVLINGVRAKLLKGGGGLLGGGGILDGGGDILLLLWGLLVALLALSDGTLGAHEGGGVIGGAGALAALDGDEALGAHHDGGDGMLGDALALLENIALVADVLALGGHVLDAAIGHLVVALGAEGLGGNCVAGLALLSGDDAPARLVHGGLLGAHRGGGDRGNLGALALLGGGTVGAGEGRGLSNGLPALALSGLVALGAVGLGLDHLDALTLARGLELLGAAVLGGEDLNGDALLALEVGTLGAHGGRLGLLLEVAVAVLIDGVLALEGGNVVLLGGVLVHGGDDDLADAHLAGQDVALVAHGGGGRGLDDGAALALVVGLLGADNGLGGGLGADALAVAELALLALHGGGDPADALLLIKLEALVAGKDALGLLVGDALVAVELGALGAGELGLDLLVRLAGAGGGGAALLGLDGLLGASVVEGSGLGGQALALVLDGALGAGDDRLGEGGGRAHVGALVHLVGVGARVGGVGGLNGGAAGGGERAIRADGDGRNLNEVLLLGLLVLGLRSVGVLGSLGHNLSGSRDILGGLGGLLLSLNTAQKDGAGAGNSVLKKGSHCFAFSKPLPETLRNTRSLRNAESL